MSSSGPVVERFPILSGLLKTNEEWAEKVKDVEPGFLESTTKGQWPKILWMGCADSRVPETVILARKPGELFVQRNVANQFQPEDDSANALLNYGVMTVGVDHVIVVGHTGCGGCIAAYDSPAPTKENAPTSPLGRFIDPVVRLRHSLPEGATVDDLIIENVKVSVKNLANSDTMKEAWDLADQGKMREVWVHGWMYDLGSGRLRDLGVSVGPKGKVNGH